MTENETIKTSKFLSLVLRHEPERIGLKLGEAGWVGVGEFLDAVNRHGVTLNLDQLKHIVGTSDKKRFAFSEDGQRIRASQGHSVPIDLQYPPQTPPDILYHGTASRFLSGIRKDGLKRMERHDVHLSAETKVTLQVGGRHGKPVLLLIRAGEMHRAGHVFRCSANGVWLVDHVPPEFIDFSKLEVDANATQGDTI
jgi:putative RNA 2'-phosphotransferase